MNIFGRTCNLGNNDWIQEHMGYLFLGPGINGLYVGISIVKKYPWESDLLRNRARRFTITR